VFHRILAYGAIALALASPPQALGATDADIAEIRNQLRDLKADYEARIRALEVRLKDAEARAASAPPAPLPASAPAGGTGPSNAFNPAISAILTGTYAHLSQDPRDFTIPGFPAEGEIGPGRRSFSLGESEVTLSANVDPQFAGVLTFAVTPENSVSVEEAYGQFLTAPYGLAPKFGRFLSGIGYLNEQHAHAWDFVDAPLAYQAFLGGQRRTDGLQVKWIAPLEHYLELGGEAGNGDAYPGSERSANGVGSAAAYAHAGGDIGDSHSWRAGVSYLHTKSEDDFGTAADSRIGIADFVWKYSPHGNVRETYAKVQGEYFSGRIRDAVRQSGWYLQGVYQFMPEWRVGARYERLDPNGVDDATYAPRKASVMADYNLSEFSRLRLQLARSQVQSGLADNQFFVQYVLSLGAHGAHKY
jgi:hypothetical protein